MWKASSVLQYDILYTYWTSVSNFNVLKQLEIFHRSDYQSVQTNF